MLQSDQNVEAKYVLIKEVISRFIQHSLDSGEQPERIRVYIEQICLVDMLVPQKLREWCFHQLDAAQLTDSTESECALDLNLDASPLFTKENVYHAVLLSTVVYLYNAENYHGFFQKNPHAFDEVSMSAEQDNGDVGRYLVARMKKTFFVAFCGQPHLTLWQEKYTSLDEGIYSS